MISFNQVPRHASTLFSPVNNKMAKRKSTFDNPPRSVRQKTLTAQVVASNRKANAALRLAANLRTGGLAGVEMKFADFARQTPVAIVSPTDSTGGEYDPTIGSELGAQTFGCLNGISQGDSASSRDGRQVVIKSLEIRGLVTCDSVIDQTAAAAPTHIMLALVLDTQTNSAQAQSEDVFSNIGGVANTASLCFPKMENSTRFKILKTVNFTIQDPALSYDGTNIEQNGVAKAFTLKWTGSKLVNYTGTGGLVAGIVDNSIHLMGFASSVELVPKLQYVARLKFVER